MRTWSRFAVWTAVGCLTAAIAGTAVEAAEVTVVATGGPMPNIFGTIVSMFERESGHKVAISFKAVPAMTSDVKQGAVDLIITNAEVVDDLIKNGDVVGSKTVVMISKIGLAVKAGAPRPDISTAEKLKAALLAAKTVGYSQQTSGLLFLTVIERLGIADAIKAKAVIPPPGGEVVGELVARGAAELGVQQVAELLPIPGIDFVGELPADLQKQIPYAAAIPAKARDAATARALIEYLRSDPARAVLKMRGMNLP